MGKSSPKPKPTALRVLHGDRNDRINDAEPGPAEGEVAAPEELREEARGIWDRLAPDLIRLGVPTPWDCRRLRDRLRGTGPVPAW